MSGKAEWIAVDWGTSNLRAWGMDAAGNAEFSAESDKGMGKLTREQFSPALLELLGPHIDSIAPIEAVICGMAGARQGWLEAPYLEAPASLADLAAGGVNVTAGHVSGRILPGVAQRSSGHEDVMRGEETQLLGLLRLKPDFSGVAILPGTHSKWAEIADGRLVRFATAMTGELFEALSTHTVLRHSFSGEQNGPATEDGVDAGLTAGLAEPQRLTSHLFRTRAAALLSGKGPDWCAGYLSGLLIGAEIAGHRDWLTGNSVPLIGSVRLNRLYGTALKRLGIASEPIDARDATLAGLIEARNPSQ